MSVLNLQQARAAEHLRKAVFRARSAGLFIVADADGMCVRITTTADAPGIDDLRTITRTIALDGGCGGATVPRKDASGNG